MAAPDTITADPPDRTRMVRSALVAVLLLACGCSAAAPSAPGGLPTSTVAPRPGSPDPTTSARPAAGPAAPTWSLVVEPDDGMAPLYSMMSAARHRLDMTMYELADPETVSLLEADAGRGVEVRVLLDQDYSIAAESRAAYTELQTHGVSVRWAYARAIFHQKTITVDGSRTAIMTLNLTRRYYAGTRDFAVITSASADVAAVERTFAADWKASGPPTAGAPARDLLWSPGSTSAVVSLIGSARHSLLVENEEMGDTAVTSALSAAAGRGVDVELVMTASPSWTSALNRLATAGVHVRTYAADGSLYIHAKVIVVDDTTALVGSQNFSSSSLNHNRELGAFLSGATVGRLVSVVQQDWNGAAPPGSATAPPVTAAPSGSPSPGAWCKAEASPANDGYSGDYDVSVTSNEPSTRATASDAGDTWSKDTDSTGAATIRLYHTTPGERITVTVGGATCSTSA